jgi:hypothetical protein
MIHTSSVSWQAESSSEAVLKALLLFLLIWSAVVAPVRAHSWRVTGTTGYLSEWELSGNVTETASGRVKEFSGPLIARHVGLCSQDGPEEKPAEIKLQIIKSGALSQIRATMTMNGTQCTFSGTISDTYAGLMDCANAKGVPVTLSVK